MSKPNPCIYPILNAASFLTRDSIHRETLNRIEANWDERKALNSRPMSEPLKRLRHHVSGAIQRGEKTAIEVQK